MCSNYISSIYTMSIWREDNFYKKIYIRFGMLMILNKIVIISFGQSKDWEKCGQPYNDVDTWYSINLMTHKKKFLSIWMAHVSFFVWKYWKTVKIGESDPIYGMLYSSLIRIELFFYEDVIACACACACMSRLNQNVWRTHLYTFDWILLDQIIFLLH